MRTRGGETLRLSEQQRTFDVGALIIPSPPPLYPRRCALALVVVSLRATRPPPLAAVPIAAVPTSALALSRQFPR